MDSTAIGLVLQAVGGLVASMGAAETAGVLVAVAGILKAGASDASHSPQR